MCWVTIKQGELKTQKSIKGQKNSTRFSSTKSNTNFSVTPFDC